MKKKKRVRKPRNTDLFSIRGGWAYFQTGSFSSLGIQLPLARKLHAWLGKYIAWAEQEERK